jgi:hypothetical protein
MPCAICWCSLGHLPGCPDYRGEEIEEDEVDEEEVE